ncbi:nucleotidyltransferase domain-containing protein [Halobacterium salinarum]|uniref:nucleotidyltransferase domain-containing protein n=1 Tax=Halobacterium salinarum TaxID=2242 RepID=UPI0025561BD2|nr:nucleotidyltransferase domain-containing protein [Halobacterium salinarum]MDL0137309.1 nucleotidyltransferase domain-containing protein [Halobacterium salinarum]MDL0140504.1 nucleotidyltransferase domain-containing protein [Halobacterium salinarum]
MSEPDLFRHTATNDLLAFLTTHRFREFSLRELATQTGHSPQSVRRAVEVLSANDLVTESPDGNARHIKINHDRLSVPEDPILQIPQAEFRQPVNAAVERLRDRVSDVVGIMLYGSVARGEADRRSDIDLWVLTQAGRGEAQRAANSVARELEDQSFGGERYAYDIDVESVRSIPTYTDAIREIVVSGIPVYTTGEFETVETFLLETNRTNA